MRLLSVCSPRGHSLKKKKKEEGKKKTFCVPCSCDGKSACRAGVPYNPKSKQRATNRKNDYILGVLAQVAISKRVKCKLMLDDC